MSQSFITAASAAKIIAPHIEKSWPNDRESLFEILDIIQETIWTLGLFDGSTKWAYVKVNSDGTITTPHGYSNLLGANIGHMKMDLRDKHFMFHENGPLKEPDESDSFSKNIQHLGDYPTLVNHLDDMKVDKGDYFIGVVSPCLPPSGSFPITTISANGLNGRPIYTYSFREDDLPKTVDDEDEIVRSLGPDSIDISSGIIEGISFPVTGDLVVYNNIRVSEIYNIVKEPTLSAVDYYLLDPSDPCEGSGVLVASLDPFQTISKYSVWRIPKMCNRENQAFCLFKRDKPDSIVNDSQHVFTSSKKALIALAKGAQFTFVKDNPNMGAAYTGIGTAELSSQLAASRQAVERTIQIKSRQHVQRKFR